MIHFWYKLLDKLFEGQSGAWVTIAQLVIDQAIFSPFFFVVYYVYEALLKGTMKEVPGKLKTELIPVSITSAKVWVPIQFITFKFIPTELRVLWGNLCALAWNIYFCLISNKK